MRAAFAFLTVLPVAGQHRPPGRAALLAFPIVGALVGLAWASTAWGASLLWGPLAAAGAVVAVDLLLTGGLHADAFADAVDGAASRKPPADAIAVMRDPPVGAVGAAALVSALLVRFAWIAILTGNGSWLLLAVAPACGRTAMVWMLGRGGSTDGSSLARDLVGAANRRVGILVAVEAAALCVLLGRLEGIAALLLALAVAEGATRVWTARFGGLVGDAVGTGGFLAETATLALLAAT